MPPIEPLDGSNYNVWKIRMETILRADGLWHVVKPSDFSAAELAAADAAPMPAPKIPMPEVEGVLRILGLWDVVCPPPPPPAVDAGGDEAGVGVAVAVAPTWGKGESRKSACASVIIFDYCDKASLSRIVHLKDAAARWAGLKTMYGPNLNRLIGGFWKYEAPAGMGVAGIARKLDEMQEDIEELCAAERPTDFTKMAALFSTVGRAREGNGEEERWAEAKFWIYQNKCSYADAVGELVKCETALKAEAKKAREANGGRRRNRKKAAGTHLDLHLTLATQSKPIPKPHSTRSRQAPLQDGGAMAVRPPNRAQLPLLARPDEMLLRHKELWDAVSPSVEPSALPPSAAAQVTGPNDTESKQSERASDIMIRLCTPRPL
ncbi:hypothetical protein V502_06756 [Pseudogymnoascus sp. VKM F-4520 (FW-2644)]|nr:hypothetical protein V502_06756 [Pseudogymnoascus sp. VKM F-4520 (FW-2644)]